MKMTFHLPIDCLNDIIEYLENDEMSLGSCLLVNRLWCKVAVRILWRNVLDDMSYGAHTSSSIISTLIACLPNESRDLLHKNGISIPIPTPKSPLFNYISFIK